MKKLLTVVTIAMSAFLLFGCAKPSEEKNTQLEGTLTEILDEIYAGCDFDDERKEAMEYYQVTEIDETYLGESDIKITEGIISAPGMSAVPYGINICSSVSYKCCLIGYFQQRSCRLFCDYINSSADCIGSE